MKKRPKTSRIALTDKEREDFVMLLAEGMHTAFRKGSDHPGAWRVWKEIDAMPPEEWGQVVDFVRFGLQPWMEENLLPAVVKRLG